MRISVHALAVVVLMAVGTQEADAQKWLKKIGKGLDKTIKVLDAFTGTSDTTTESGTTTSSTSTSTSSTATSTTTGSTAAKRAVTVGAGDLALFELMGNVRTCAVTSTYSEDTRVYKFDTNGKWTYYDDMPFSTFCFEYKRNTAGRLYDYTIGEYDAAVQTMVTYNIYGQVVKEVDASGEENCERTYTYDASGWLTRKTSVGEYWAMGADSGEKYSDVYTYKYLASDSQGNWTRRQVTKGTETWTETRTITYY